MNFQKPCVSTSLRTENASNCFQSIPVHRKTESENIAIIQATTTNIPRSLWAPSLRKTTYALASDKTKRSFHATFLQIETRTRSDFWAVFVCVFMMMMMMMNFRPYGNWGFLVCSTWTSFLEQGEVFTLDFECNFRIQTMMNEHDDVGHGKTEGRVDWNTVLGATMHVDTLKCVFTSKEQHILACGLTGWKGCVRVRVNLQHCSTLQRRGRPVVAATISSSSSSSSVQVMV